MVSPASRSSIAHLPCPEIQKMEGKTCLWQDIMNGFSGGWFMNHFEPKQELHATILNLLSSCFFLSCRFNPACACGDQLNQSESNVSETSRKNDIALLGMSRVMIVSWMLLGLESIWSVAEAFANLSQQLYVHTRGMAVWYILGVNFQVLITITLPSLIQGSIRDRNGTRQCL